MTSLLLAALLLLPTTGSSAQSTVVKECLWVKPALVQGLANGDLEQVAGNRFVGWSDYHKGYETDGTV